MANEIQLIAKAALLAKAQEFGFYNGETHYFHYVRVSDIENAPTVDAEPVVHAYWIKEQDEHGIDRGWKCSNCRGSVYEMTYEPYKGCPHCRAKMDLKESDHEISV